MEKNYSEKGRINWVPITNGRRPLFYMFELIQYEGTVHLIEVSCTKYLSNYDSQSEKRYK